MNPPAITAAAIELRCPHGFRNLLAKIRVEQDAPPRVSENLLELSCRSCLQTQRKKVSRTGSGPWPVLVVHRFSFVGELVETLVEVEE